MMAHWTNVPVGLWGSRELCRRSGASYRQVDHWVRRGYLLPADSGAGSGTSRLFAENEVVVARFLAMWSGAFTTQAAGFPAGLLDDVRDALNDGALATEFDLGDGISVLVDLERLRHAGPARIERPA